MAKQKKNTPLSSLSKAFATACKFPSLQPAEFRKSLDDFKKRTKATIQALGIEDDTTKPPVWTADNRELKRIIQDSYDTTPYMLLVRDIILYTWYQKKFVFTFQPDTVDFILNKFPVKILNAELDQLLFYMCRIPVYLEFPDNPQITGAFCGITGISNRGLKKDDVPINWVAPSHFSVGLTSEGIHCMVHCAPGQTVENFMDSGKATPAEELIYKALLYVFFLHSRQDADGVVLVLKKRQDVECWDVRPVPFPEALPNPGDSHGSISAGLSFYLGFLSRDAMVDKSQKDLKELEEFQDISLEEITPDNNAINRKFAKMILDWEAYRVVFQYDWETEAALHDKYFEALLNEGIRENLLRYMPQKTVVLYQKDQGDVFLVSTCKISGSSKPGLVWGNLQSGGLNFGVLPVGQRPTGQAFEGCLMSSFSAQAALCALLHILIIYESKAIKKLAKDTLTAGDPSTTALVPYQGKTTSSQTVDDSAQKPTPEYRISSNLEYTPFELFDLTDRTIKRVRQAERLALAGWKMPPHTRRPHPHRYWVGSGANKHMEVRWLDRIQVHKEKAVETTTLHNVK